MKTKTLNYDLMHLAQVNAEISKRNENARNYLAQNKKKTPSDLMLLLSGLSVSLSIVAAYFVCCLF